MDATTGLELRSTATADGRLELTLVRAAPPAPGPNDVTVRVEATPINPSDLGLLLGPVSMSSLERSERDGLPVLSGRISENAMASVASRLGEPMAVGNEGAGTVIAAGDAVQHLIGKRVGMLGGAMYAQLRTLAARDCVVLPDGATAADGAAMFVNPLTALGFTETMKLEGHEAIVHFAAASNLGQMLVRICKADAIPLVNVVRSEAQAALLRAEGAEYVVDSSTDDYEAKLTDAIAATGATLAFDPIGGGRQAGVVLSAMEAAANRGGEAAYSRYGSTTFKQVYIYGALDLSPTILDRWVGFSWSVGGWLLTPFLGKLGLEGTLRLRQRVVDELTTTFASKYTRTISLSDVLDPGIARAYQRKATGEKFLIDPTL